jgi:hypothetical protein
VNRRLSLARETLAELTPADLTTVVGAVQKLSDKYGQCTLDNSYLICQSSACPTQTSCIL